MRSPVLLVVDDDVAVREMLERFGRRLGFEVEVRSGGRQTLDWLTTRRADVALIDLQMPEVDGLAVLRAIRDAQPECQVVLMTGYGTIDTAIEAVKLGALDYVSKPLPLDRLKALLTSAREQIARRQALFEADRQTGKRLELCGMIGRTPVMQELFGLIRRLAPHVTVTLVTGETGTGKELVARALHQLGPRRGRRFITVNCSAVVENLFESELFGHLRGAFTGATETKVGVFEAANGGTVFLDEIGELPPAVQAKLLRVLEAGEVQRVGSLEPRKIDVHVIAATNRNLEDDVADGGFRRDLYYRLNVVEIALPPLRNRCEDVPYLTAAFLASCRERFQGTVAGVTEAAETLLTRYSWPGNVRELRNVVERACLLAEGQVLTERDVLRALPRRAQEERPGARNVLRDMEQAEIERALAAAGGNKTATARRLGVSRRLLYRRLERYRAP